MTPSPGIEPGPHWWEACVGDKCSTTVPSLLLLSRSPPFSLISRGTKRWRVGKEGTEPGGKVIDRTDRTEETKWGMNHLKSGEKRRVRKVNELGKKEKEE